MSPLHKNTNSKENKETKTKTIVELAMSDSPPRRKPKQLSSEHLPYDVVFDILTQLPVKSLIKFRCVSKSWNSMITKPDFIKTHFDIAKSLSHNNKNNNKGYILYMPENEEFLIHLRKELCTVVCNSNSTFTEISMVQIPITHIRILGFSKGMFCLHNFYTGVLYLWNPSIRKFKMLPHPQLTHHRLVLGFAYHSQNSDYKILRTAIFYNKRVEAEVYTLSTDSWRKVQFEFNIGSIVEIDESYCFYFNGALHSIVSSQDYKFILSFDLNDERFREIMLPPNYLDGARRHSQSLAVFKGSLALIVLGENLVGDRDICDIWVMREYGVVESWTKQSVLVDGFEKYGFEKFFCCTDSGELLIHTFQRGFVSYDPENLNWNKLLILRPPWLSYTADLMESLVLLDQVKCN